MKTNQSLSPVLFIPHGAGPLPLLGDQGHQKMVSFLQSITPSLGTPSAILVISAHWEASKATISSAASPELIYDYFGFADESYDIQYPSSGDPILADKIFQLLQQANIDACLDDQRGFDHGLFVPLKIMYPKASIPCVQLSLINSLDPIEHIKIGQALSVLRKQNILIVGSGFSFHNLKAIFAHKPGEIDSKNIAFERWLVETCTDESLADDERKQRLVAWHKAPYAEYCHPREEHLLPLHVCAGLTDTPAKLVFNGEVMGKKTSAFLW